MQRSGSRRVSQQQQQLPSRKQQHQRKQPAQRKQQRRPPPPLQEGVSKADIEAAVGPGIADKAVSFARLNACFSTLVFAAQRGAFAAQNSAFHALL